MEGLVYDYLSWAKDETILGIINKEILYYSNKIIKINHFNISQDRVLILTDEALYNFHKKKSKRRIEYNQIRGITYSKQNNEFVVHGNDDEYDYYFQSNDRNLILNLISKYYEEQNGKILKICEVNEKSLRKFVTDKKEKKKDKNFSKMDETKVIDSKKFFEENTVSEVKVRAPSVNVDEETIEEENPPEIKTRIIFNKIKDLNKVELEDFKIIKILGRGIFGKVYLVQNINNKMYYSMKSVKKEYLIDEKEIEEKLVEKKIIEKLDNQFIIGTLLCFETEERIYFIMNLIKGESMVEYMRNNKNKKEEEIRFFMGIIGIVIDYLHKNGIKYRDIRPNDIIIEKDGYIKISELKISKLFKINKNEIIIKETSEYLAPEIINTNEDKPESDWWTYGIILYELLFNIPPYYDEDDSKIKEQIIKTELRFPKNININKNAKDLIKKLLNKNPNNRLGHLKGFDEIKNHDFFKGLDFDKLNNKKINPVYKPNLGDIINDKENDIEISYEELIQTKLVNK